MLLRGPAGHGPHMSPSPRLSACWATYPWVEKGIPKQQKPSNLGCPAAVPYTISNTSLPSLRWIFPPDMSQSQGKLYFSVTPDITALEQEAKNISDLSRALGELLLSLVINHHTFLTAPVTSATC